MTDNDNTTSTEVDNAATQNNSGEQSIPDGYMSQDEVNAIMARTRKEARQRTLDSLLGELGVDSPDTLKSMLSDYNKRREAEMSEAEKAQARADKLQHELDQLRAEKESLAAQAETERRNRIISDKLKESGAAHPDDLLVIAPTIDLSFDNAFTDDGKPIAKELDNIVATLKKERPNAFISAVPGSPSNSGGRVTTDPLKNPDIQQQIKRITRM